MIKKKQNDQTNQLIRISQTSTHNIHNVIVRGLNRPTKKYTRSIGDPTRITVKSDRAGHENGGELKLQINKIKNFSLLL